MSASGTNFPTSLDVFNNKVDEVDDILAEETNTQSSAIYALESKVGITNSADTNSLDYKIDQAIVDPMTTRGDILVRDASNDTDRLAVGTSSQVLMSDGVDTDWRDIGSISGQMKNLCVGMKASNDVTGSESASFLVASKFKCTSTQLITHLGLSIYTVTDTKKIKYAIYSDSAGYPDSKLGETAEAVLTTAGDNDSDKIMALSSPISASFDTVYWLVFLSEGAINPYKVDAAQRAGLGYYIASAYASGFPATFTGGGTVWKKQSMFGLG